MGTDSLYAIAAANGGLVTRGHVQAAGLAGRALTELVRQGRIARVARGAYSLGSAIPPTDPRVVTTVGKVALSHESAAAWLGADLPLTLDRTQVTAPRNRGRRSDEMTGVRLHRADLTDDEIISWRGVQVTSPLRTALDVARHQSLENAVAILDSLLRIRLVSVAELARKAASVKGPGSVRIQQVVTLLDPRAGSVLESLTRVLMWRHDLRAPTSQYPFVHPTHGLVGYFDFGWERQRAILECDGFAFHATHQPFQKDRRRWSAISSLGWRLGVVTWHDVTSDPAYVVDLVRDLLAAPT